MSKQLSLWDVDDCLAEISADGDPLEKLSATVDFERFRPILETAAGRPRGAKGGRPALDIVLKFKMPVLHSLRGLSLEATDHMVRDRMTWLHFCGLELNETVPDVNTLWDFREAPVKAGKSAGEIWPDAAANDDRRRRSIKCSESNFISRSSKFGWNRGGIGSSRVRAGFASSRLRRVRFVRFR